MEREASLVLAQTDHMPVARYPCSRSGGVCRSVSGSSYWADIFWKKARP